MPGRGVWSLLNPHSATTLVTVSHSVADLAMCSARDVMLLKRYGDSAANGRRETRRECTSSLVLLKTINKQPSTACKSARKPHVRPPTSLKFLKDFNGVDLEGPWADRKPPAAIGFVRPVARLRVYGVTLNFPPIDRRVVFPSKAFRSRIAFSKALSAAAFFVAESFGRKERHPLRAME
jgi:hypothetical protein